MQTGKYGEEIARLRVAETALKKAMEHQKQVPEAALNDLKVTIH